MSHRRLRFDRLLAALAALALVATLGGYAHPPVAQADTSPFTDIVGTTFEADIDWLYTEGVTVGCTPTLYCPERTVTRGEMASFLARMFDLPATTTDYFSDDDGSTHETDINRLAEAGITKGCTATTFCPDDPVIRGAMASFLARAIPLYDGGGRNYFADDDGTTHEAEIDRAAAAGIANGCAVWRFCPTVSVTRGQMAGFLHRVEQPINPPPYPAPTGPQTLYVATDGSDTTNLCRVESAPCATIAQALSLTLDGDTVAIAPGTYLEEDLVPSADVTIRGDPAGGTTIDGRGLETVRIFTIAFGRMVRLEHLTVTGGFAYSGGGGGILNHGTLTVDASTIYDNEAGDRGGGILSDGPLTVTDSTITENRAFDGGGLAIRASASIIGSTISGNDGYGYGGGISKDTAATLVVADSTIRNNGAGWDGGGVYSTGGGTIKITRSTVDGNSASIGGGLNSSDASFNITNSTISFNYADHAGGIRSGGMLSLTNSTVSGNSNLEWTSPGIINLGTLSLKNALVVGNLGPRGDIVGAPITTKLNSIVGIPVGLTLADILDPAGLADNGGPTQTIALTDAPSNPAIDKGHAATCAAAPVSGLDQRGLPRTPPCDIGAYEL